MVNGRPQFGTNCIRCLGCLQHCPKQAIRMGGVTVRRERYHNPNVMANELAQTVLHFDQRRGKSQKGSAVFPIAGE